jgi:hypothetical protein
MRDRDHQLGVDAFYMSDIIAVVRNQQGAGMSSIAGDPVVVLLTGCQQITELRVMMSGTSSPRNDRERLIFDYYHALRDRCCEAAYGMWAGSSSKSDSHDYFIRECMSAMSLPVRIAIGQARQTAIADERCGYSYTIYVADPGSGRLTMGELGLVENPQNPGSCQVAYNSAFGPM